MANGKHRPRPSVQRTLRERLEALEYHVRELGRALNEYEHDKMYFKSIVTQLRVLVADHKPDNCLLLQLNREFGVHYTIPPTPSAPGLFGLQSMTLRYWKKNFPDIHQKLLMLQQSGDPKLIDEIEGMISSLEKITRITLSDIVNYGSARITDGQEYSYGEWVRILANQTWEAHESPSIDRAISASRRFVVMGHSGDYAALFKFSKHIFDIGQKFIIYLIQHRSYSPRYEWPQSSHKGSSRSNK